MNRAPEFLLSAVVCAILSGLMLWIGFRNDPACLIVGGAFAALFIVSAVIGATELFESSRRKKAIDSINLPVDGEPDSIFRYLKANGYEATIDSSNSSKTINASKKDSLITIDFYGESSAFRWDYEGNDLHELSKLSAIVANINEALSPSKGAPSEGGKNANKDDA